MFTTDGICDGDKIVAFFIHQYEEPIFQTFENSKRHITRTCYLDLNDNLRTKLFKNTQTILRTFNKNGEIFPFHMEWFYDGKDIIFCEAASRFGGKIGQLIKSTYSFDIYEAYWNLVLNNGVSTSVDLHSILKPKKISFNYSAYLNEGTLTHIPDMGADIKMKAKINEKYMQSANIQQNAFETYKSVESESEYRKSISELDRLNQSLIYQK